MTTPLSPQSAYHELSSYTLTHPSPEFIHQYVVDAFAAQTADKDTKPITILFALVGLYLHLEKGFTGRAVQLAHMQLGKVKESWPIFPLPQFRGTITVFDVVATPPGLTRDAMIKKWINEVWEAWGDSHAQVGSWLASHPNLHIAS